MTPTPRYMHDEAKFGVSSTISLPLIGNAHCYNSSYVHPLDGVTSQQVADATWDDFPCKGLCPCKRIYNHLAIHCFPLLYRSIKPLSACFRPVKCSKIAQHATFKEGGDFAAHLIGENELPSVFPFIRSTQNIHHSKCINSSGPIYASCAKLSLWIMLSP